MSDGSGVPIGPLERFRDFVIRTVNSPRPRAGAVRLFAKSDGLYVQLPSGAVSGPIAPSGGNYTSAVLWTSGTSMPGGPATNQRITRTDLGRDFYYDGTRWLETTMSTFFWGSQTALFPTSAATTLVALPNEQDFDWYMYDLHVAWYVATTNNGTNYWNWALVKNTAGTNIVTGNTSAGSANTWTKAKTAINALLGTAVVSLDLSLTKTSAPGTAYFGAMLTARRVGT